MNISLIHILIAFIIFSVLLAIVLILTRTKSNSDYSQLIQKLASLENTAVQIQEIGKEVSSLKMILHAPKLRGNFGEYLLYNLLKDTLPPKNWETQFSFSDGAAVDAIIKLGKHIIPVDSKFPLESFERYLSANEQDSKKKAKTDFIRSIKTRIDEISKKYIRPQEGTFDFALMYIPSESVYYEILTNDSKKGYELFDYAMKNRVITVSPNTFYAYLMSVVYGLKGLKIEEQAETIIRKISGIQNDFSILTEELNTLGKHISNANTKFIDVKEKTATIKNRFDGLSQ